MSNNLPADVKISSTVSAIAADKAINAVIDSVIGYPSDFPLRPRDIPITTDLKRAGYGAKATPRSFINALAVDVTQFAHGAKVERLVKDYSKPIAAIVAFACSFVSCGKGITAGQLRNVLAEAMAQIAVRVAASAPKAPKIGDKGGSGDSGDKGGSGDSGDDRYANLFNYVPTANGPIPSNWKDETQGEQGYFSLCEEEARAKAEADAARAKAEAEAIARYAARDADNRHKAIALCELATALGIKLTKPQLALLDKIAA